MSNKTDFSIVSQVNGSLLFRFSKFEENCLSNQVQRNSHYSLIWIKEGTGNVKTGFSECNFQDNTLFAFAPFQPFVFSTGSPVKAIVIDFYTEFIFIHEYEKEKGFKQVLYNNEDRLPFINIDLDSGAAFDTLCEKIEAEIQDPSLAQHDLLAAYLRIFLINVSRMKLQQQQTVVTAQNNKEHYILQKLKDAIEENFRAKHAPGDYAAMLYVTTKTLTKVSKTYYNKTVSDIINERIIIEAKRELFLTNKAIKEIAYYLGYEDEYYFSRFFKVNTAISPQKYREGITAVRA